MVFLSPEEWDEIFNINLQENLLLVEMFRYYLIAANL